MNQKGFANLVLIGIVVILLAVGGYLAWSKREKVEPVVSENSQVDTSNWKTYTSTKYGFEFKYPEEYPPTTYDPKAGIDVLVGPEAETLRITTKNSLSTDAFADFLSINPYGSRSGSLDELTLDRILKAIKLNLRIYTSDPDKVEISKVTFAGKDAVLLQGQDDSISVYKFTVIPVDKYNAIAIQQNIKSEIYSAILSTFKFTEPNTETTVTILVPENLDQYEKAVANYVQVGGPDPRLTWKFTKKEVTVSNADNIFKASAQAAAEVIQPGGGPAKASIAYFEVKNGTAYVLLDIDLDGWAGVSVSIAKIHPLVENTLLLFPEIKHVVFGYAPKN